MALKRYGVYSVSLRRLVRTIRTVHAGTLSHALSMFDLLLPLVVERGQSI